MGWIDPLPLCPVFPQRPPPTSITDLRPQDVKVVMALGDSITAGFGMLADGLDLKSTLEYRGHGGFTGGEDGVISMPNFLKHYTANNFILGASTGNTTIVDADCFLNHTILPNNPEIARLNAAQSCATVQNLLGQLDWLYEQMPLQGVDVENDWKVLTIWIGANNMIDSCDGSPMPDYSVPSEYGHSLNDTIASIYKNIPRVFVNILPMFNVTQVTLLDYLPHCPINWMVECPCVVKSAETRAVMDELAQAYNQEILKVVAYWKGVSAVDFAVVMQPATWNLIIPSEEFVSKFDCFHPSYIANFNLAIGVWNNMISPAADKFYGMVPGTQPLCAQEDTLLYTY